MKLVTLNDAETFYLASYFLSFIYM